MEDLQKLIQAWIAEATDWSEYREGLDLVPPETLDRLARLAMQHAAEEAAKIALDAQPTTYVETSGDLREDLAWQIRERFKAL
jgi:hypothetical protein